MSAYLVSKPHIDALVAIVATERKRRGITMSREMMSAVGALLIRANVQSIEARYPDTIGHPEEMPGPNIDNPDRAFADSYVWSYARRDITPIAALSLIACYEYQACEFDGFAESEAGLLCRYLTLSILARYFPGRTVEELSELPGWRQAPWGI